MQAVLTEFGQTVYARWEPGLLSSGGGSVINPPTIWVLPPDNNWTIAVVLPYTSVADSQTERDFDIVEQSDGWLCIVYASADGESVLTKRSHNAGRNWV